MEKRFAFSAFIPYGDGEESLLRETIKNFPSRNKNKTNDKAVFLVPGSPEVTIGRETPG